MYVSFIIAGLVFIGTIVLAFLALFAAGMSDVTNADSGAGKIFIGGMVIAALIAATHWLPHMGW